MQSALEERDMTMVQPHRQKIVFFGSGPVAAESLRLLAEHTDIEAVITRPLPAHHRGEAPVLQVCKELKCNVHTPNSKQELTELFQSITIASEQGVVIDYGIIIEQPVIDAFPLGIINSHFSLLPQWRGADPITFAILSGQKETGVSLMLINEKMDEGNILSFGVEPLSDDITSPELTKNLIGLSDALLRDTLPKHAIERTKGRPQEEVASLTGTDPTPTYSRKLTKADGLIDWTKPAEQIERDIRGFIEWPKSRTTIAGKDVIITKAHVVHMNNEDRKPGDASVSEKLLVVECGQDSLAVDMLKPAGKKEMPMQAFLAGNKL